MRSFRSAWLFALIAPLAFAQAPTTKAPAAKAPEPAFAPVTDVAGLSNVLLLGDSISMGYTVPVRTRLAGKANVHRPAENCSESANGVKRLDAWLGSTKWTVIHFNFGLHDLKYLDATGKYVTPDKGKQVASLADYEKNLRTIVARLKLTGAKLVFATTTPVPSASAGRVEHDELAYNEVAQRVMREFSVPVDDLHAVVVPRQNKIQLPHNVHYTPEGYEALADAVVSTVAPFLPGAVQ